MKDKWIVHKLHSILVQEETKFKNQENHSVHYVSHQRNQRTGKKFVNKHDKGKRPLKINDNLVQIQTKALKSNNCHLYEKSGHF